jgi:hypothetical protein
LNRRLQQHPIVSGLAGQKTLHEQLEDGQVTVKRGINRFTADGVYFKDKDGNDEATSTKVDAVIFATGYRQQAGFIDPQVVDLRWEREGNDVPLWKGCVAVTPYQGLGFVNFVQSLTFLCAELQSRLITRVFKGLIPLPTPEQQMKEVTDVRATLSAQYIDRSQLRVQHGANLKYYDDLARAIGCYPSLSKLLIERPSAVWHTWLTFWQPLQWRMVGPGRLEMAEEWIEQLHHTRYHGFYMSPSNPRYGSAKPGLSHAKQIGVRAAVWTFLSAKLAQAKLQGLSLGPKIEENKQQYVAFARRDVAKKGIPHSFEMGEPPDDGFPNRTKSFVFSNRSQNSFQSLRKGNTSNGDPKSKL